MKLKQAIWLLIGVLMITQNPFIINGLTAIGYVICGYTLYKLNLQNGKRNYR